MIKGVNKSMLSATATGLASGTASPSTGVSTVAGSASSSTACRGSQKDKVTVPTDVPALSPGDFRLETLIGEGLNGKVYHEKLNTGENVALKMLDVFTEAESSNEFLTKVSRVATLQHDNLVKLRGYCDEENNPFLAYEYATKGSLHDMLHGRKGVNGAQPGPVLDWIQRVKIALDAAKGLEYLHQNVKPHIVHGDIRSNNVLLFEGLSAKIADFDFSIRAPDLTVHFNSTGALGTSCYHAPEYAMTKLLTPKTDVYSFGLLLLEILTGRKCDQDDDTMPQGQQSLLTRVRRMLRKGIVEQCVDPSLKEYSLKGVAQMAQLAAACVMDTPEVRPSMGIVVMRLENILTAPTGTSFTSMLQKKLPAGNFFGTDSNPLYDSNIIARYEREVDEAEKESSEERINECLLQLSRARVHSKRHKDVELGIAMLEGSMNCTSDVLQFQRIIYLLAVGLYRRGDYSRSRHLADHCLKFVPDWREAINLKKAIEDCIKKDEMFRLSIAATAFGAVGILATTLLFRKK